jgi:hypothetical protein
MALVKLDWNRKSVPDKLLRGRFIIMQMTANTNVFPNPAPSLVEMQASHNALHQAAVRAYAGGILLTAAKTKATNTYNRLIAQLAAYVQNISAGSEEIILKAGMEVRQKARSRPSASQVNKLRAYPSRKQGTILISWTSLGRGYVYQLEMCTEEPDGMTPWTQRILHGTEFVISDLERGRIYYFRVAGIGTDNVFGSYSQEANSVAP